MKRTLLALALIATPFAAANASELSYNYVEAGYTRVTGVGTKTDGVQVGGSAALGSNFHLFGNFSSYDLRGGPNVDVWKLGVGYNHSLSNSTDLIARVGYEEAKASGSSSLNAYFTEVGVRGALGAKVEGYALAGYERAQTLRPSGLPGVSIRERDGEFYGRLGALVKLNNNWGINADVKFIDGDAQYFIGPRLSF